MCDAAGSRLGGPGARCRGGDPFFRSGRSLAGCRRGRLLFTTPAREKSIGDYLREVIAEDVRLLACSMASAAWVADDEALIPAAGFAGATAFVARTLDPTWRTLVF